MSGSGGDMAGLVRRHLPSFGGCPDQPEAMPQI
jgi:hypothetical protein